LAGSSDLLQSFADPPAPGMSTTVGVPEPSHSMYIARFAPMSTRPEKSACERAALVVVAAWLVGVALLVDAPHPASRRTATVVPAAASRLPRRRGALPVR
jgi:hypothetical protein